MFKKIYRVFYRDVICARNPLKYARKIGVNFAGGGAIFMAK